MPFMSHRRNLIVLSTARSGSTLLVNYLNSSPHVRCHGEIMRPEEVLHVTGACNSNAWLRAHVASFFRKSSPTYLGAKFLINHFEGLDITIEDVLETLGFPKVIAIYRSNLLESYVSLRIALQNHIWYSTTDVNEVSIPVNLENFLRYVARQRDRWRYCLRCPSGKVSLFYVRYEELVQAPQTTMDKVFSFLEIASAPVYTEMIKQNPGTLREKIANYDALSLDMHEASKWLNFCLPADCAD